MPKRPLLGRWFLASSDDTAGGGSRRNLGMAIVMLPMDYNRRSLGDCDNHYLVTNLWREGKERERSWRVIVGVDFAGAP